MLPRVTRRFAAQLWTGLLLMAAVATLRAATHSAWFTRVWQTSDGLPNNSIMDIAQGHDGYLWVGTAVGLARFDGVRFTEFAYKDFQTGEDLGVHALRPSRAGGLWIVPGQGPVIHLDAELSRGAVLTNGALDEEPLIIIEDRAESIWIANRSGTVDHLEGGRTTRFGRRESVPTIGFTYGLTADAAGNVWLAKGGAVGVLRDGQFRMTARLRGNVRVAAARGGGVWLAAGTKLFRCGNPDDLLEIGQFQPDAPGAEPRSLMEDSTGAVWIGTVNNGLFRYSGSGFERIQTSHPNVVALAEDREGNVWAGTAGGGLNRISTRSVNLEGLDTGSSLVAVQSVCEATNGVLWGATQNGLLVSRADGGWKPALTNETWLGVVTCVAADRKGGLWIGTGKRQLHYWHDNQHTTWSRDEGMLKITITGLLPASTGDLWIIGYATGVPRWRDGEFTTLPTPPEAGRVLAAAEDAAGRIWVGTSRGQLLRVEGDQLVNETPRLPDITRAIRCLYATPDGAMLIGYEGLGLGRMKQGVFSRIGVEQGLADNYISQIIADDEGWLWFGSNRGIFKIRQHELEQVLEGRSERVRSINYGQNEGSPNMEADFGFLPGALRSRDGLLWMPMRSALAAIDPQVIHANPAPPPVRLTRVTLDGKPLATYGGLGSTQPVVNLNTLKSPLPLPPGHRKLDFEFTALHFAAPENVHFRYRLDGLDYDWSDAEIRSVGYTRLAAGDYRFRVEACVGDGPWSETPAALAFTVAPFIWQTWWFRLGVLLLFTSTVITSVRYVSFRRLRTQLRTIEQQATLDKERSRIARDLHDDLGGSLTHTALVLDMARREKLAPDKLDGKLGQCSNLIRQVARSVDEIIWAINPRNDTLPFLIDYISQFAVEFLHAGGVRCRVDLPDRLPERNVSPEMRHNLFLVVKESLTNIVRHAQAGDVRLQFTATDECVAIVIQDDGRGFAATPAQSGADGLRNMRQRMEEIGGQFEIQSQPGAGTRVVFRYFWPQPPH